MIRRTLLLWLCLLLPALALADVPRANEAGDRMVTVSGDELLEWMAEIAEEGEEE